MDQVSHLNDARSAAPGWLRTALLLFTAAMAIVAVERGFRFFSSTVMMGNPGLNKNQVIAVVKDAAGLDDAAAEALVKSATPESPGQRPTPGHPEIPSPTAAVKSQVPVASRFSAAEATALETRLKEAGAEAKVERFSWRYLPLALWGLMNAMAGLALYVTVGMSRMPAMADGYRPPPVKFALLCLGGVLGLSTIFVMVVVPLMGWAGDDEWRRQIVQSEKREAWKTLAGWTPFIIGYCAALAMFAGLLAIRSEERSNATLRHILYGYTAVLNVVLLAGILVLVNVMLNFYVVSRGKPYGDWTAGNVYSISDGSRDMLRQLKQPVRFIGLFRDRDQAKNDVEKLLENFKSVNPSLIEFEFYNPASANLNERSKVRQLSEQYRFPLNDPNDPDRDGLSKGVLIIATTPDGKEETEFIKRFPDLFDRAEEGSRVFKGEQALMSAIVNLTSDRLVSVALDQVGPRRSDVARVIREATGLSAREAEELVDSAPTTIREEMTREQARDLQQKLQTAGATASIGAQKTIYITQNNGEPTLAESPSMDPYENASLGYFRRKLEEAGYTVKPLPLQSPKPGAPPLVPRDASLVIVAGPASFDKLKVDALREYMKDPKHRMIVLLEPHVQRGGELQASGLEPFLEEFGVQAGTEDRGTIKGDVVLNGAPDPQTGDLVIERNDIQLAKQRDSAMVGPFQRVENLRFTGFIQVRSIRPKTGGDPAFRVSPFLETWRPPEPLPLLQWAETDLRSLLTASNRERIRMIEQKLLRNESEKPPMIPIAVTVRRSRGGAPAGPHAPNVEGDPCMIVIGDVTLATNAGQARELPDGRRARDDTYYNLLIGAIAWLRDRPDQIQSIQAQTRKDYKLQETTAAKIEDIRFYPGVLFMTVVILGGIGVFIMRRR